MNEAEPYGTRPNAIMFEPTAAANVQFAVKHVSHGRRSPTLASRPLPQPLSALASTAVNSPPSSL